MEGPPGPVDLSRQHPQTAADATSGDSLKKFGRFHFQSVRKPNDVQKTDIPLPALNSADIIPVQIRQLGEALLRKTAFRPQFADSPAKQYAGIWCPHLTVMVPTRTLSVHTL